MSDFSEFAEDGFDPVAWINSTCAARVPDEPLDKFLAELEMRLQLTAEDLEASLQDNSSQAMRRIPFAIQEIYRLQGDIQGMQDQVRVLAHSVQRDAQEAGQSVSHIGQLHHVKVNMESACSTLKEATELSGLFVKVEEVFAAGDLPKAAEILASMRRSLSLVGDVPEFRAGRQKLKALEDRLQTMIEGSLADAIAKGQDDEATRKLCGLLLAVDRFSIIQELYINSKLAQVHGLWEEHAAAGADTTSAAAWLPAFLSKLLQLLEGETKWGASVLPNQAHELMATLCTAVFNKISKGARERLAPVQSISALTSFARELASFGQALFSLLKDVPADTRQAIMLQVYAPLEDKVSAYGELEARQLSADLRAALPESATASAAGAGAGPQPAEDTEALVGSLAASLKDSFATLHSAAERCSLLTGGSEVRAMLKAVDQELATYLGRMQLAVASLSARHKAAAAAGQGAAAAAAPEDVQEIASVLQLIKISRQLAAHVSRLETSMRVAVAGAISRLQALAASATPPSSSGAGGQAPPSGSVSDPVLLRLLKDKAERLAKLAKLGSSMGDARFIALPNAASQADLFAATVQNTVFEVLLARVGALLAPLPAMHEWRRGAGPAALPSFSAYPLPYVTAIGDYLMALPQQLEVLMGDAAGNVAASAASTASFLREDSGSGALGAGADGGGAVGAAGGSIVEDDEELAAEWLDKTVTGAAGLYGDAVFKITELGHQGGMQLAADVEYFVNVMGALHVAPPAALLTVQLLAGVEAEEFKELGRGALADGAADAKALRALAAMRNITLEA